MNHNFLVTLFLGEFGVSFFENYFITAEKRIENSWNEERAHPTTSLEYAPINCLATLAPGVTYVQPNPLGAEDLV